LALPVLSLLFLLIEAFLVYSGYCLLFASLAYYYSSINLSLAALPVILLSFETLSHPPVC